MFSESTVIEFLDLVRAYKRRGGLLTDLEDLVRDAALSGDDEVVERRLIARRILRMLKLNRETVRRQDDP